MCRHLECGLYDFHADEHRQASVRRRGKSVVAACVLDAAGDIRNRVPQLKHDAHDWQRQRIVGRFLWVRVDETDMLRVRGRLLTGHWRGSRRNTR